MSKAEDVVRLRHMLDAARKAMEVEKLQEALRNPECSDTSND